MTKVSNNKNRHTSLNSWNISRICFNAGNTMRLFFTSSTNFAIHVVFCESRSCTKQKY